MADLSKWDGCGEEPEAFDVLYIKKPAWNKMKDADGKTWYQSSFPLPIDTMLGFPEVRKSEDGKLFRVWPATTKNDSNLYDGYCGSYKKLSDAMSSVRTWYEVAAREIMQSMLEDHTVKIVLVDK